MSAKRMRAEAGSDPIVTGPVDFAGLSAGSALLLWMLLRMRGAEDPR